MGFLARLFGFEKPTVVLEPPVKDVEPELTPDVRKSAFDDMTEPRASFTVTGVEDGRIRVEFDWNKPFIQAVNKLGFQAETEEDTVQLFFYASSMRPTEISDEIEDLTAPEVRLSESTNRLVE